MTSRIKISSIFRILPGEGQLIALLLLQSFFLGATLIFARISAFTLFLVEFDAQTLPYVYIGAAVADVLIGFIYLKLGERLSFSKLLVVNLSFQLAGFVALRLGLGLTGSKWLVLALPIWFDLTWVLSGLAFWSLAGHLLTVRQGKRLFGLIWAGMWAANVIGGFLVPSLVEFMGTRNLLLLAAAGVVCSLGSLIYIMRQYGGQAGSYQTNTTTNDEAVEDTKPITHLLKNRYVVLLCALITVWWLGFYFIDNIFYGQAAIRYPTEEQLARFIGPFFAISGLVTVVSTTFVAGPLLNRYGLKVSLLITPVILLIGTALTAVTGTIATGALIVLFWLVTLTKLFDIGLGYSIDKSAQIVLYQPLPANQRVQTLTFVDSIMFPVAAGLAGITLLIFNTLLAFTTVQIVYILLFILVAWVGVVILLGREYPVVLMQALVKRKLSGTSSPLLDDGPSVAVLRQALQSSHPGVVIYALDRLEESGHDILTPSLVELLDHHVPQIRQEALQRIERLGLTSALEAVRERLRVETSIPVRSLALRTLASLGEIDAVEEVYPYLEDPDLEIRLGAILGLLSNGGPEVAIMAGGRLIQLAVSANPTERALAAQVLGEVRVFNFHQLLMQLLQDEDRNVRRAALMAAGKAQHAKLWPLVLAEIASPELRCPATTALVAGGEAILPELESMLNQEGQERTVLIRLIQVCGRIRGDGVVALLKDKIDFPNEDVRTQILRSLHLCGYQAQGDEISNIEAQLITEAADAAWTLATLIDIGDDEAISLLHGMLTAKLAQNRARLFYLLSFIYDAKSILHARDNLNHAHAAKRAYALEVLDLKLSQELKGVLLPLLNNDFSPNQRLHSLNAYFPQPKLSCQQRLQEIITGPDDRLNGWIKSCALYMVDHLSVTELSETVVSALSASDPLVRETALWTISRLNGVTYDAHINALRQDPNPQIVQTINQLETGDQDGRVLLSRIEKVIILKTVSIFAETPTEILAEVALLLQEVELKAGETVFEKGEMGDCLYIIVDGQMRVHDGEQTLDLLGPRSEFGEMAVLDPEPRVASVTAVEDTLLLRLDQEALFELMDDRIEVARGIIRVLSQHLRAWVKDLNELQSRLTVAEQSVKS